MRRSYMVGSGCLALLGALPALAFIDYTGGTYGQSFDTLPTQTFAGATLSGRGPHALSTAYGVNGVDGWEGANPGGSSENTEFKAHDGSKASSAGRGVISYGTDDDTDRALGVLATSNQINSFGLVLRNATNDTYAAALIECVGEQWRRGNVTTPNTLTFGYLVSPDPIDIQSAGFLGVASLDFTSPNQQQNPTEVALDGNLPENQSQLSGDLGGLNWTPGSYLVVRWAGEDISGQDDGLGIDSLHFTTVPEPGTALLLVAGLLAVARARR